MTTVKEINAVIVEKRKQLRELKEKLSPGVLVETTESLVELVLEMQSLEKEIEQLESMRVVDKASKVFQIISRVFDSLENAEQWNNGVSFTREKEMLCHATAILKGAENK